jgi:GNAT superfamily N-acetyltransferase
VAGIRVSVGERNQSLADRLDQEIYAFNVAATGLDDGRLLSVKASASDGTLAGGLSGWTWGACMYVDLLWVREDQRGHGLGSRILDTAEQEAVARGCSMVSLSTHSFQAPEFYLARGYAEVGRTDGYPVGHSQLHLVKRLGPVGGPA